MRSDLVFKSRASREGRAVDTPGANRMDLSRKSGPNRYDPSQYGDPDFNARRDERRARIMKEVMDAVQREVCS